MISAIIMIKYKPMYKLRIGNKDIGYVENKEEINYYITSFKKENNLIAFIDYLEEINLVPEMVSRSYPNMEEEIKQQLFNNMKIEYTTYAITYQGNNIAYVATMEEAEKLIDAIKKEKESNNLGILQVYSEELKEIKPSNIEKAQTKVAKILKQSSAKSVKVAKAKKKTQSSYFTVKPLSGIITSRFGGRSSPGGIGSTNHKGLDIAAKAGTIIKASGSGTVTFAGYKGSLGNLVIISNGEGIETYYGHCSKLYVKKGQKIKAGDTIAAVGSTGAATGPHLHFEVHVNGRVVNPQKYIY